MKSKVVHLRKVYARRKRELDRAKRRLRQAQVAVAAAEKSLLVADKNLTRAGLEQVMSASDPTHPEL